MRKVTTYQLIDGIKKNLALIIVPAIVLFGLVMGLGIKKTGGNYEASTVKSGKRFRKRRIKPKL